MLAFRRLPADEDPAAALIEAMVADVSALYGGRIDGSNAPTARPDELRPPGGACVVGFDGEAAVCVGAVKRLDDGVAEIKRMYVLPEARGRGVARELLRALEDTARDLGYARVRLDTGPEQVHARALYDSAGYTEIADYNANPHASFWGEKRL